MYVCVCVCLCSVGKLGAAGGAVSLWVLVPSGHRVPGMRVPRTNMGPRLQHDSTPSTLTRVQGERGEDRDREGYPPRLSIRRQSNSSPHIDSLQPHSQSWTEAALPDEGQTGQAQVAPTHGSRSSSRHHRSALPIESRNLSLLLPIIREHSLPSPQSQKALSPSQITRSILSCQGSGTLGPHCPMTQLHLVP